MDQPTSPTISLDKSQLPGADLSNIVLVTVERVPLLPARNEFRPERRVEKQHSVFVIEVNSGDEGLFKEELESKEHVIIFLRGVRASAFPRELKVLPKEWEIHLLP